MNHDNREIERIARAERMLGEYVGRTFANVVGDIAISCGISIERMLVHVREPGTTGPEPALHFVITEATFDAPPLEGPCQQQRVRVLAD